MSTRFGFENGLALVSQNLQLCPLEQIDLDACANALWNPDTWFVTTRGLNSPARLRDYLREMIARQERGEACTLLARDRHSGEVVGISTFAHLTPDSTRVEVGFTWISERWQRTHVNREMKYLMLEHAFQKIGAYRVEFLAHPNNAKSNRSLEGIGAVLEGTLKRWRTTRVLTADNGDRNIYRILAEDWLDLRLRFLRAGSKSESSN